MSDPSTSSFHYLRACLVCGQEPVTPFLDLGAQPLANAYHDGTAALARYPLGVARCPACCHVQLIAAVDGGRMFRHYLYVSGTTRTLKRHFAGVVAHAAAHAPERIRAPRVLDIGANDGSLLAAFRDAGWEVQGVDPAANLAAVAARDGIPIHVAFWDAAAAEAWPGRFHVLTGLNVFGHTEDPRGFLAAAKRALAPGGVLILEMPYGGNVLTGAQWDHLAYHEHRSTWLVAPLAFLAFTMGWTILDLQEVPVHGGSLRVTLAPGNGLEVESVLRWVAKEDALGLYDVAFYGRFRRRVTGTRRALDGALTRARAEGRAVVGYGASAKLNTVLNAVEGTLEYVVDDNPLKQGLLTPGRDIPIRGPVELANEPRPLALVPGAWNFLPEILERVAAVRDGARDTVIEYVPEVRVRPLPEALAQARREAGL